MGFLGEMYGKRSPDFVKGVLAGLHQFAWYKDGTQYVGTVGTPLREAMQEVINDLAEHPEDFDIDKMLWNGCI